MLKKMDLLLALALLLVGPQAYSQASGCESQGGFGDFDFWVGEWEVFDSNMAKIGDSVFHMSCSDSDMNGPEDCALPQGDGKDGGKKKKSKKKKGSKGGDSSSDRFNQWLFEGMVDAGESAH